MKDDIEWFMFIAGMVAGIGVSLAAFIAILFLR
jgi:uncharacterized membrane protein